MNTKLILICIGLLSVIRTPKAVCQSLAPVDTSGFGKNHPVRASVTEVSTSTCRIVSSQDGALRHYDIKFSAKAIFENISKKPAILFKHPVVLTVRVAASEKDLAAGRFITGLDGDRIAISGTPDRVSINDFESIGPGKRYATNISTTVPFMPDSNPFGRYWVQLGIDARPDVFYYEPKAERGFARKWGKRGEFVDFLLAKPFPVNLTLGLNVPLCER